MNQQANKQTEIKHECPEYFDICEYGDKRKKTNRY